VDLKSGCLTVKYIVGGKSENNVPAEYITWQGDGATPKRPGSKTIASATPASAARTTPAPSLAIPLAETATVPIASLTKNKTIPPQETQPAPTTPSTTNTHTNTPAPSTKLSTEEQVQLLRRKFGRRIKSDAAEESRKKKD
jgi:hypothetical protein